MHRCLRKLEKLVSILYTNISFVEWKEQHALDQSYSHGISTRSYSHIYIHESCSSLTNCPNREANKSPILMLPGNGSHTKSKEEIDRHAFIPMQVQ